MLATSRRTLGAPGVYRLPDTPAREPAEVRLDVCGFAGVAPRGPARVPAVDEKWREDDFDIGSERPRLRTVAVPVESFDEYRRHFGGFEGPGLLPYAVAAFFESGGRRAYVARIVHDYGDAPEKRFENARGVARGRLLAFSPLAALRARNEGSWGNRLRVQTSFSLRRFGFEPVDASHVKTPGRDALDPGTLLRFAWSDGTSRLLFVESIQPVAREDGEFDYLAVLEGALPPLPPTAEEREKIQVEIVELNIAIEDGCATRERFDGLGLSAEHPRWAAQALFRDSVLVHPSPLWAHRRLRPRDASLAGSESTPFRGGRDRYVEICRDDFFDPSWTPAEEQPGAGIQAFARLGDLSSLAAPDLYSPKPLPDFEPIVDLGPPDGPSFGRCLASSDPQPQERGAGALEGLHLDPGLPSDFDAIVDLQRRLVEYAESVRYCVALLDVPPGLKPRDILKWRAAFASSYAAAYHPWLTVARRDDGRDRLIQIPPSAAAAGIIAGTEFSFGISHGPANVCAGGVVGVAETVAGPQHDELHPLGINVFLHERAGVRLTAARTLSSDLAYRQLSVRRLMLFLRRTLELRTQWLVFEPNGPALQAQVRQLLTLYLRRLFKTGAFKGTREEEAFFARCDEALNPPAVMDAGRLIAEVGVAPAEPLEFILLRLTRNGDGTLTMEE